MLSETSEEAPPIVEGRIGIAGRIIIWLLALLLYGGGLAAWFAAMPVVSPVIHGALSILQMFASHDGDEPVALTIPDESEELDESIEEEAPAPAEPTEEKKSLWDKAFKSWPSIKVVGVMSQQGTQSVMLDKDIVPVGGSIRGISVIQVETGRVLLSYEGEQKWILVGDMTDAEAK